MLIPCCELWNRNNKVPINLQDLQVRISDLILSSSFKIKTFYIQYINFFIFYFKAFHTQLDEKVGHVLRSFLFAITSM